MKKVVVTLCMAIGLMTARTGWAETYVYGTIDTDTIWTQAESPYIATDTVTVIEGVSLTIEPEVAVRFATNTSLICYGILNAVGTPDGTITFTSDQATHTAGHWNGIKLSGAGAAGGQISYCDIGYAKQGLYLGNVSEIVVTNNYIHDHKGNDGAAGFNGKPGEPGYGIYLSGSTNNIISENVISSNQGGNGGYGSWGKGGKGEKVAEYAYNLPQITPSQRISSHQTKEEQEDQAMVTTQIMPA
jgi:hypothetical protein